MTRITRTAELRELALWISLLVIACVFWWISFRTRSLGPQYYKGDVAYGLWVRTGTRVETTGANARIALTPDRRLFLAARSGGLSLVWASFPAQPSAGDWSRNLIICTISRKRSPAIPSMCSYAEDLLHGAEKGVVRSANADLRIVTFQLDVLALLCVIRPSQFFIRWGCRYKRLINNQCVLCAYYLAMGTSARCPECGTAIDIRANKSERINGK